MPLASLQGQRTGIPMPMQRGVMPPGLQRGNQGLGTMPPPYTLPSSYPQPGTSTLLGSYPQPGTSTLLGSYPQPGTATALSSYPMPQYPMPRQAMRAPPFAGQLPPMANASAATPFTNPMFNSYPQPRTATIPRGLAGLQRRY